MAKYPSKDWRKVHRLATDDLGYEYEGINGAGHPQYRHPVNHRKASFAATPSDHRAIRNAIKKLARVAALPPLGTE